MKKLSKILVLALILVLLIGSFAPVVFAGNPNNPPTKSAQPKDQVWYTTTVQKISHSPFYVGDYLWTCTIQLTIIYRWNWVTGEWEYADLYYNIGAGPKSILYPTYPVELDWYATGYAGSENRSANGIYRAFNPGHCYDNTYHLVWHWSVNYPNPHSAGETIYVTYQGRLIGTLSLST